MAWMRLSFIGLVMSELMAAGFGTEAAGVKMGIDPMTNIAFTNAIWTMILGSFGSLVSGHLVAMNKNTVEALAGGAIMTETAVMYPGFCL